MDNNELNVNSLYDYLICEHNRNHEYKLVIIITNKQVVLSTSKRNKDDHWDRAIDIVKLMYPERESVDDVVSNGIIVFTSIGNDLEVDIPQQISETQLQEVKNILRQVRQYEYEYDSFLFMPYDSREIIDMSNSRLSDNTPDDDDEVIIGTKLGEGLNK